MFLRKTGFYLINLCLFVFTTCFGEIHLAKEQNDYIINDLKGYTQEVHINGFADDNDAYHIYFNQLEEVDKIDLYISVDNLNWVRQKMKKVPAEDASYGNFYNGLKLYSVSLITKMYFKLSYTVKSKEIKMLASLTIKNYLKTDSIINTVTVANPFLFSWQKPLPDSSVQLITDVSHGSSSMTYSFISLINTKISNDQDCVKKIYCIVHSPENKPEQELGHWFCELYKSVDAINQSTISEIDKITTGITDTLEIARRIFNYVKKNISYIDIEAGYGAWIPRKADEILMAHKGDCKDMANLIYQMLKYKKVNSYLGIMPTISHPDNFIFPSLGCANHMICVVFINSKWCFLDATDKENSFDLPSRHAQGRTVFCINSEAPFQLKIPVVPPEQNKIDNQLKFNISDTAVTGTWDIEVSGHSAVNMLDLINSNSQSDIHEFFDRYFKTIAPKLKVIHYSYNISKMGKVSCHVDFQTALSMISYADGKHYLSLKFLPALVSQKPEESHCGHIMYTTVFNNFNVNYHFSQTIKLRSTIHEDEKEMDMNFESDLKQPGEVEMQFNYSFLNPYLEYNTDLFDHYVKITSHINKSFNNVIIYE